MERQAHAPLHSAGTTPILFYFDFLSPYGYLGSVAVARLGERLGRPIEWRPVLLGVTVLKVMGLKALPDTPVKRDYVFHDVARLARLLDIPLQRCPAPMRSLSAMRAWTWFALRDPALAVRFGQALFHAQWAEARDMSAPEAVAALAAGFGPTPAEVLEAIEGAPVKDALRTWVEEAVAAGVFGVPSFVVDGEMFWGVDRLPMLERWIETGGW